MPINITVPTLVSAVDRTWRINMESAYNKPYYAEAFREVVLTYSDGTTAQKPDMNPLICTVEDLTTDPELLAYADIPGRLSALFDLLAQRRADAQAAQTEPEPEV